MNFHVIPLGTLYERTTYKTQHFLQTRAHLSSALLRHRSPPHPLLSSRSLITLPTENPRRSGFGFVPPPPDRSQVDKLPSKLRKILAFSTPQGSLKLGVAKDPEQKKKRDEVVAAAAPPAVMLLSCVMAFSINYCVFWNTTLNSALTQTICGNLKDVHRLV